MLPTLLLFLLHTTEHEHDELRRRIAEVAMEPAAVEELRRALGDGQQLMKGQLPYGDERARALRHAMLLGRLQRREDVLRTLHTASHPPSPDTRHRSLQLEAPHAPPASPAPPLAPPAPEPPPPASWDAERVGLTALYEACGGATWGDRTNWLDGLPCIPPVWAGVECLLPVYDPAAAAFVPSSSPAEGHVRALRLIDNALDGAACALPSELGHLTHLRELSMPDNRIGGTLPRALVIRPEHAHAHPHTCHRRDAAQGAGTTT